MLIVRTSTMVHVQLIDKLYMLYHSLIRAFGTNSPIVPYLYHLYCFWLSGDNRAYFRKHSESSLFHTFDYPSPSHSLIEARGNSGFALESDGSQTNI